MYAADVVSKVIVVATLSQRPPVRLLGGFLTLRVLRNSGAAFSIGTGATLVFTLIAVGVIVFILRTSRRLRSVPYAVALGLLLGGATGNLTDRLLRSPGVLRGDVVDWIQLPHWPVFNLADSAIVCGGVLWVLLAARGFHLDGTREPGPDEEERPPAAGATQGPAAAQGRPAARAGEAGGAVGSAPEPARPGEGARPVRGGATAAAESGAMPGADDGPDPHASRGEEAGRWPPNGAGGWGPGNGERAAEDSPPGGGARAPGDGRE